MHHSDTVNFAKEELEDRLGVILSGKPENWFSGITYTAGGGVDTLSIGGKTFTGIEIRSCLGLRSTAFTMDAAGDVITVTTSGFGHRVGLSQYGADAMAASGSSFVEILAYYYRGTTLELTNGVG